MWIISAVWDLLKSTWVSYDIARKEVKFASGFETANCEFITDYGKIYPFSGTFTKDRLYFKPKGIDRLIKADSIYDRGGVPTLYVHARNCESLKIGKIPEKLPKTVFQALENRQLELKAEISQSQNEDMRKNALEAISFADYGILGADVLSSYACTIMDNIDLLRYAEGLNRGRILLLVLLGFLVGLIIGGIVMAVILLVLSQRGG